MTDREKMAREIGFAAWLDEQRENFDEAEIEDERHATMRGENDHWSEIKAALSAYNKGRADMREEAAVAVDTERMLRELHKSRALDGKRKQEARDFETMAIAHVQSAAAIRAIPVEEG